MTRLASHLREWTRQLRLRRLLRLLEAVEGSRGRTSLVGSKCLRLLGLWLSVETARRALLVARWVALVVRVLGSHRDRRTRTKLGPRIILRKARIYLEFKLHRLKLRFVAEDSLHGNGPADLELSEGLLLECEVHARHRLPSLQLGPTCLISAGRPARGESLGSLSELVVISTEKIHGLAYCHKFVSFFE